MKLWTSNSPPQGISGIQAFAAEIDQNLQKVSVHRKQCRALGQYCIKASNELRDAAASAGQPQSPMVQDAIQRFWEVFAWISEQSRKWRAYNLLLAFFYRSEIQDFVNNTRNSLEGQLGQLGLLPRMQQPSWNAHFILANEEDQRSAQAAEEKQQQKEAKTRQLQEGLSRAKKASSIGSRSSEVQQIMNELHQLRTNQDDNALAARQLTEDEVKKVGHRAIQIGDTYDIWRGTLHGREDIVIKIFRGILPSLDGSEPSYSPHSGNMSMKQGEDNVRRWNRQIDLWRALQHENILKLHGVVYLRAPGYGKRAEMGLVTPYLKYGDAAKYFHYTNSSKVAFDRINFIIGMARGLKHLHTLGIVHGGMQGSKVLVANDGSAILSDFSVAKFMADNPLFTGNQGSTNAVRWLAPEAIAQNQQLTAKTDVYSWSMTALQVLAGREPFYKYRTLGHLIIAARDQTLQPDRNDYSYEQINDYIWGLLSACWTRNPDERPTMDAVLKALEANRSPTI